MKFKLLFFCLILFALPQSLRADTEFSVTFAPVLLARPTVEFTGEMAFAPGVSAAVILGAGTIRVGGATGYEGALISAGTQVRYYFFDDNIQGWHVGGEFLYDYFSPSEDIPDYVALVAGGGNAGVFAGYKFVTDIGLTFDIQLGYQYAVVLPIVHGNQGIDAEETLGNESLGRPLLNLNVGWTVLSPEYLEP